MIEFDTQFFFFLIYNYVIKLCRWIYWNDQATGRIEGCALDGRWRQTVLRDGAGLPNQMTMFRRWYFDTNPIVRYFLFILIVIHRKLFYVDASENKLMELDPVTGDNKIAVDLNDVTKHVTTGITSCSGSIYLATWNDGTISRISIETGDKKPEDGFAHEEEGRVEVLVRGLGSKRMGNLACYGEGQRKENHIQPCYILPLRFLLLSELEPAHSPCSNAGCSHLCFPLMTFHSCACPSYGTLFLSTDGHNCSGEFSCQLKLPPLSHFVVHIRKWTIHIVRWRWRRFCWH